MTRNGDNILMIKSLLETPSNLPMSLQMDASDYPLRGLPLSAINIKIGVKLPHMNCEGHIQAITMTWASTSNPPSLHFVLDRTMNS